MGRPAISAGALPAFYLNTRHNSMGVSLCTVATQLHFLCSLSNTERLKIEGGFLGRFCCEPQKDHTLTHKESFQCHYGNKFVSCQERGWRYQLARVTRRIPVFRDSGLRNSLIHFSGLRLSQTSTRPQHLLCRRGARFVPAAWRLLLGGQFICF